MPPCYGEMKGHIGGGGGINKKEIRRVCVYTCASPCAHAWVYFVSDVSDNLFLFSDSVSENKGITTH